MRVIANVAICPLAFNAFEELKAKLGWRPTLCGGDASTETRIRACDGV